VNFQDLGLVLKVTPSVHTGGEISLELEAEYNVLGADTANNIPVISRRKYQGKVRLANGEWGVIAGLVKNTNSKTGTGLPWTILRKNTVDKEDTELILLVKPRLTNLPPWEDPIPTLWVGTESKPLTMF
jgi:Flp pilus assembly secretin CpaC